MKTYFSQLRPLRIALIFLATVIIIFLPKTEMAVAYSGWGFVITLLIPTMLPLVFFVLLLDIVLSLVLKPEAELAEQQRLNFVLKVDILFLLGLIAVAIPYFLSIA